jgi:DNA helicase-2/ATP-dependent DNA helicase PcrA
VLNVVDGCIPSDMATGSAAEIDEERRLLYVAMTRARDRLTLMVPQRFYVRQQSASGDRHVLASRSRFIPPSIARHFDAFSWPAPTAVMLEAPAPDTPVIDLAARIRGTWKT